MEYGYCRVSTRGQLDGNSIEEQQKMILERYPNETVSKEKRCTFVRRRRRYF